MKRYLLGASLLLSQFAHSQNFAESIALHREAYKANFIKLANSPLNADDLKNLSFYPADSTFSVTANVEILKNERIFKMPTYSGTTADYIKYAKLKFVIATDTLSLTLYKSIALASNPAYRTHLFLPFTDLTNGNSTYGGGRYIDTNTTAISNGQLTVDFNKAYNPYCAYSDGYRCPIPPAENDLPIAINAGEKTYTGEKKKSNN